MGIPNFRAIHEQCEEIRRKRAETFPLDSLVQVQSHRFKGIGIVTQDETCPIDQLPVMIETLMTWFYPLEDCTPWTGRVPSWVRTYCRKHGMKLPQKA